MDRDYSFLVFLVKFVLVDEEANVGKQKKIETKDFEKDNRCYFHTMKKGEKERERDRERERERESKR